MRSASGRAPLTGPRRRKSLAWAALLAMLATAAVGRGAEVLAQQVQPAQPAQPAQQAQQTQEGASWFAPVQVVEAFWAAIDARDLEGALSLYSDDVRIADWWRGRAEGRRLLQIELALGRRYRISEIQAAG